MINVILDFIEQNWEDFVAHCKHHGITDVDEIEDELQKLLKK